MQRHRVPKKFRRHAIGLVAGVNVAREIPQQLRHLRVAVQAGKDVLVSGQRIKHRVMIEMMREIQPALIARVGIKIGEHFVHAAEFRVEHFLSLRFIQFRQNAFRPCRKLRLDFERRAIARITIGIAQSRKRLVQRVPRRPHAVQVKEARTYVALCHFRPLLASAFERAEITIAILVLHFFHLFDEIVRALFESRIAGRRVH